MKVVNGDLLALALEGNFDVIVHGCNCHCTMGRGIAASIREQFPEAYEADLATPKGSREKLGSVTITKIVRPTAIFSIVNAYTQFNWSGDGVLADYNAIRRAFRIIKQQFTGMRIGYPRIGAGLAGGDWSTIAAIIEEELNGESHTLFEFVPREPMTLPRIRKESLSQARSTKISKFLSLVLRHKPDAIGITLDEAGWIDVAKLLDAAARHKMTISREELSEVVAANDKQRFAFSEDRTRIRANQGHSVSVDLGLTPVTPPEILYHGTATRFLEVIRQQGLKKMQRQHVHLCADMETASNVGERHGKLAMLRIRAGDMHRAGIQFFVSTNGVWLTDAVATAFIVFPE